MLDRLVDFTVIESESLLIGFQIPYCNFPFRNYHSMNFGIASKNNHIYLKRFLNTLAFLTTCLCEAGFS